MCGESETQVHTFDAWEKVDNTNHKRTCECGAYETQAHTWPSQWSDNGDNHHKVCSTCLAEQTENHSFGKWSRDDDTNHKRTCACGAIETVKHTYSNDSDTSCNDCGHTRTVGCTHARATAKAAIPSTCKVQGYAAGTFCPDCNIYTKGGSRLPLASHQFGAWQDNGSSHIRTCTVCKTASESRSHTTGDWVKDKTGHWRVCSTCGVKKDFAAHTPGAAATESTAQTCKICGYVIKAALGHTHSLCKIEAVKATCTASGTLEHYRCTGCDSIFLDADGRYDALLSALTIAATGHTEVVDAAVAPTCTEDGMTEGKHCKVCDEVTVVQKTVKATGHSEVIDIAVDATCGEVGLTEGKHCDVCGEVLVAQETIAATGEHVFGDWQVTTEATEEAEGVESRNCTVCGVTERRKIDKLEQEIDVPLIICSVVLVVAAVAAIVISVELVKETKKEKTTKEQPKTKK